MSADGLKDVESKRGGQLSGEEEKDGVRRSRSTNGAREGKGQDNDDDVLLTNERAQRDG